MRRNNKRIISFFVIISLILGLAVSGQKTFASGTKIIKVKGFQISSSTKLSKIEKKFGKAKLVTDSMYGGKAYSFYGTDYKDYVFLESDASGKWIGGGAIGCSFQTQSYKWNTVVDNYVHDGEALYDFDDGYAYGACEYYVSSREHEKAKKRYNKSISCRIGVSKHALLALNAANHYIGDEQRFTVTDDDLAIVEQIYEKSGMTIKDYMDSIGKGAYYHMYSKSRFDKLLAFMCPFSLADEAINYIPGDDFTIPVLSFRQIGNRLYREAGFLNPKFLEDWNVIQYTDTEKKLLENARGMYEKSISYWNKNDTYYTVTPSVKSLPIEPGKIEEDKLRGATYYINMIRAGADLAPFEYDAELCQEAQNKAALVMYCNYNRLPSGHDFEKPEGVPDDLYNSAMKSGGENLFMCGILGGSILGSIYYALDDTYGDSVYFGHRYALLAPGSLHFGIGEADGQGCHKFTGGNVTEPFTPIQDSSVIAWPSRGVSFLEITGSDPVWSIQFNNGYKVIANQTKVTVTLLNTGDSWSFGGNAGTGSVSHCMFLEHQINFQSAAMILSKGNVYQIKIDNLEDMNGNKVSYSYRSVIESLDENKKIVPISGIKISKSAKTMVAGEIFTADYQLEPNNATQLNVDWSSSNSSVASVNDCGIVTAKKAGTAVISVKSKYGDYTASYKVTVKKAPQKVKLKTVKKNNGGKLLITWNKCSSVKGYEVEYSTDKRVENAKTITVNGAKNNKAVTKRVKKGIYYIRVRTYCMSNGTKVYGEWSKIKKFRVKK